MRDLFVKVMVAAFVSREAALDGGGQRLTEGNWDSLHIKIFNDLSQVAT